MESKWILQTESSLTQDCCTDLLSQDIFQTPCMWPAALVWQSHERADPAGKASTLWFLVLHYLFQFWLILTPSGHELQQSSVITEEKLRKCEMYDFNMPANYKKTTAGISAASLCEVWKQLCNALTGMLDSFFYYYLLAEWLLTFIPQRLCQDFLQKPYDFIKGLKSCSWLYLCK